MSQFKLFPSKDATIYSLYPYVNTGLDEILELSLQSNELISTGNNTVARFAETSRALIQFSSASIQNIVDNKISGSVWRAYLKLSLAKASNIPKDFAINVFPISGSWDMGTGRYGNVTQSTDGVSWLYNTSTTRWDTGSLNSGTTSSFTGSNGGGGVWYTGSMASQSFNYNSTKDIELDVTEIVNQFYSGSIPNNGFILKQASEFVLSSFFDFKFFSMDTHTIYPPNLEFRWYDGVFNTGSLTVANSDQIVLTLADNKGKYQEDSIQRFRIKVRDKFPARQFLTSSVYLTNKALPSMSYWAIKDLHTEETVVGFDTGSTIISCDPSSSYFNVDMSGLEPERNYRFLIKSIIGNQTLIFDDNYIFKVVR